MPRPSAKRRTHRRSYDNSLREEQARQTRQRILEAVADMLAGSDGDGFSMARVAEAAGVSEPTLYRHFANRETLMAAVSVWLHERMRPPRVPESFSDAAASVLSLFEYFGEHADIVRASVVAGPHREIREHARQAREARIRALVEQHAPHLDARRVQALYALVRLLVRGETYVALTGEFGLSSDEAGEVTAFAIDTIARAVEQHRRDGRTDLVDDATRARSRSMRPAAGSPVEPGSPEGDR